MNRLLIFICFIFSLGVSAQSNINQVDASGKKQGIWQKKQENGKLMYEGTFKDDRPVGEFKRYHSNGVVKAIINYAENSDTADVRMFDQNRKLIAKGKYLNQQKAGKWIYYSGGQLVSEEYFMNGLKNGKAKTFYPSGELFEESDWINNQQTGIYRAYLKNGKLYLECQMKNGQRDGFCQVYHPNGEPEMEAFYQAGLRHNEWKYFDENGKLLYTLIYDLGVLMNPEVSDSLHQAQFNEMEKSKDQIVDPEKFMSNPMDYIQQSKSSH